MKRYLNHSLLVLSLLTLIGFLLHFNNTSSVAHANLHVVTPIAPIAQLTDSLRTVSITLDREIASLSAEQMALRGSICLPVESNELDALMSSNVDRMGADVPGLDPDVFQIANRIEKQQEFLHALSDAVDMHRDMSARVPVLTPVNGVHTSGFGLRVHPITGVLKGHTGMDISTRTGTPIHVSGGGLVVFSGVQHGYGNVVIVDHGYGYRTLYGHCSKLLVKVGETVTRNQTIALVGSTGASTGPHLHYEVIVDGSKIDPSPFLIQPLETPAPAIAQASAQSGRLAALKTLAAR
jgi:hypothetical protein